MQNCSDVGNKRKYAWKEPKQTVKWVSGVRKLRGTRKTESCDNVAKEVIKAVGKMASRFSVGKQMGQLNGKNGWWFVVKAQEKNLLELDEKWKHKHWQWQRVQKGENDFRGGTCVEWAQVKDSIAVKGAGKWSGSEMQGWKVKVS